ncbi:MAG: DUF2169 domain-containing protein, partial [Deltaproteobacteria bacterium]|nr:DUF2169 domain-containing protein [Deltaproteobacteria bacterium]
PFRGLPLPNLEDPGDPFQAPGRPMTPVCYAPVAPTWAPRSGYVGTYDDAWDRTRAPFLPDDFDERHYHCAPEGLVTARPLVGAEPIVLEGVSARGVLSSRVPQVGFDVTAVVAGSRCRWPCRSTRSPRARPATDGGALAGAARRGQARVVD